MAMVSEQWKDFVARYMRDTGFTTTEMAYFCRPGARGRICVTEKTVEAWLRGMAPDSGRERGWRDLLERNKDAFVAMTHLINDISTRNDGVRSAQLVQITKNHVGRRKGK